MLSTQGHLDQSISVCLLAHRKLAIRKERLTAASANTISLSLRAVCPCARPGTCPLPAPTIREATGDVIWTERAESISLFFLSLSFFLTARLPQNQYICSLLIFRTFLQYKQALSFQQQTGGTPCQAHVCVLSSCVAIGKIIGNNP